MILIEDGELGLDDPIVKYLPELASLTVLKEGERLPLVNPITVRHLLTHTAGFSYGWNPRDPVDALYANVNPERAADSNDFLRRLSTLPLKFEPGKQWHYGVAVDVLGVLVERISGKPFNRFLHERLFEPLGMVDTFFNVPAAKLDRFLPNHVWDWRNRKLTMFTNANDVEFNRVNFFSGGGGLVSTTADYFRFAEMLRQGGYYNGQQIVPQALITEIQRGGDREAFARFGRKGMEGYSYHDQWWVSHNSDGGFEAMGVHGQLIHVNPTAQLSVVRLGSHPVASNDFTYAMTRRVMETLTAWLRD